jgi:hypothetical protein
VSAGAIRRDMIKYMLEEKREYMIFQGIIR